MPKRTTKRTSNKRKNTRTRKQKTIIMIGCSKKNKKSRKNKVFSTLGIKTCSNCGPNCHCGPNCKCPHPCPGTCYLNRHMKKQRGGIGCGSCSCPISPMSVKEMNKFGGYSGSLPPSLIKHPNGTPVIISPPQKGYQDIVGIYQQGGSCNVCGNIPVVPSQSGGNFFKPIGPIPGPTVGNAWGPNLKWPAMNDIGGDRNFLSPYNTNKDPQLQELPANDDTGYINKPYSLIGGYKYKKKNNSNGSSSSSSSSNSSSSTTTGGGLIPQDLVNLGRDFTYNFKSAYNAINGYKAPVDPAPYKGQLTGALNNNRFLTA